MDTHKIPLRFKDGGGKNWLRIKFLLIINVMDFLCIYLFQLSKCFEQHNARIM